MSVHVRKCENGFTVVFFGSGAFAVITKFLHVELAYMPLLTLILI